MTPQPTAEDSEKATSIIDWDRVYRESFPAVQFMSVSAKDSFEATIAEYIAQALATTRQAVQKDYEEASTDHKRLVRELDVLMNGDGAASQASLCDIVAQFPKWLADVRQAAEEGQRERIGKFLTKIGLPDFTLLSDRELTAEEIEHAKKIASAIRAGGGSQNG